MICPMYKDFTRECVEKFEEIIYISNLDLCDSDRYKECPFYRHINEPEKRCEYADKCMNDISIRETPFEQIMECANTYCFTENKVNCERYKVMKTGKVTPEGLRVDGSRIEIKT